MRHHGSTSGAVNLLINQARKHDEININIKNINLTDKQVAMSTSNFYKGQHDIIKDDVEYIVDQMIVSDLIVYACPVYAFGVNSLMQAFLERSGVGYLRFNRPLEGKLALIMITGRRYSHENAWSQIALNVMLNKMILVGSGFVPDIRNDGQKLGEIIADTEGITSIQQSVDKAIEYYIKLHEDVRKHV